MAIRTRLNAVIEDWCGEGAAQDQNLQQHWTSTRNNPARPHAGVDFNPAAGVGGVQDLIGKLTVGFRIAGPDGRDIPAGIEPSDFEPKGSVKTVDDLVNAVVFAPDLS